MFKQEQERVDLMLSSGNAKGAVDYIFQLLKSEHKDHINMKLLATSYLCHITDQFCLKDYQNYQHELALKVLSKANKLICNLKEINVEPIQIGVLSFEASYNIS